MLFGAGCFHGRLLRAINPLQYHQGEGCAPGRGRSASGPGFFGCLFLQPGLQAVWKKRPVWQCVPIQGQRESWNAKCFWCGPHGL